MKKDNILFLIYFRVDFVVKILGETLSVVLKEGRFAAQHIADAQQIYFIIEAFAHTKHRELLYRSCELRLITKTISGNRFYLIGTNALNKTRKRKPKECKRNHKGSFKQGAPQINFIVLISLRASFFNEGRINDSKYNNIRIQPKQRLYWAIRVLLNLLWIEICTEWACFVNNNTIIQGSCSQSPKILHMTHQKLITYAPKCIF